MQSNGRSRLRLGMILAWMVVTNTVAWADGRPPAFANKPLPIYRTDPAYCYVLLRPQWPYVQGGNYPVCRTVLRHLNRHCAEPPQYDQRKFHLTSKELTAPTWKSIDAMSNLDIVKWIVWPYESEEVREGYWAHQESRVRALAERGELRLLRADAPGADLRGGTLTVYRLENLYPKESGGSNQLGLMLAEPGERTPTELFSTVVGLYGELLKFRDNWFLFTFDPTDKRFLVKELVRPRELEGGAVTVCSIEHVNDRSLRK